MRRRLSIGLKINATHDGERQKTASGLAAALPSVRAFISRLQSVEFSCGRVLVFGGAKRRHLYQRQAHVPQTRCSLFVISL